MAKPRLRITTPSIRPQNLHLLEQDSEMLKAPKYFDVRWTVLLDCFSLGWAPFVEHHKPALWWESVENVWLERGTPRHGEDLYNALADTIQPDEWWMGLADDSLPTPRIFESLRRAIDGGADVVMFPMDIPSVVYCKSEPKSLRPGHVSGGQVFHRRDVQGDLRWKPGSDELDGVFVRDLWDASKDTARWKFMDWPVISHNQLRGNELPGGLVG